jgi:hypothetical protein
LTWIRQRHRQDHATSALNDGLANVRLWSKADMFSSPINVRFLCNSGSLDSGGSLLTFDFA